MTTNLHTFFCSNQYYAIWSQSQCCVVVSGFNGQRMSAVIAEVINRDFVANRTYYSVAIMGKYYVSKSINSSQKI